MTSHPPHSASEEPNTGDRPGLFDLWRQAGGGTGAWDPARYRDLLREHGHLLEPGDEGYEEALASLPCRWPGKSSDDKEGPS